MDMIECVSDETNLQTRYTDLAKRIISESGLKNISHAFIDIEVKEGCFLVSVDLKEKNNLITIESCGDVELTTDGIVIRVNPSLERRLPSVIKTLRKVYGLDKVIEKSRFEILVSERDIDTLKSIIIDETEQDVVNNVMATLDLMSPEGFRISKTMKSRTRITMLCSQYKLKESKIQQMIDVHNR